MNKANSIQNLLSNNRIGPDELSDDDLEQLHISEVASIVCGVVFLLRLETKDHKEEEIRALDSLLSRAETKAARIANLKPGSPRTPMDVYRY